MSVIRWWPRLLTWLRAQRQGVRIWRHGCQARWLVRCRPELLRGLSPEAFALHGRFRGLSVNRANLLRLQLDRVMRPQELQELLLAWLASQEPSPALSGLLSETLTDAPALLRQPAPFDEAVLVRNLGPAQLRWYRAADGREEAPRRLVVAFTSNANALAMIAPCFLQLIHPFASDVVLVVRDQPHHRSYYGAEAEASLLARILQVVHDLRPSSSWGRVATIGYSGGGVAALVAAWALGADRGVSLGGWPPQGAVPIDAAWLEALRGTLPAARKAAPQLLLCCAEGCRGDRQGTLLAERLVQGWPLPPEAVQTRAYAGCRDHNLLVELQRRGYALAPVVADLLGVDEPLKTVTSVRFRRRARWRPLSECP